MRLPVLTELPNAKEMTEEFRGYNHNLRIAPNEWYNEKNMSTAFYPFASPRGRRFIVDYEEDISRYYDSDGEHFIKQSKQTYGAGVSSNTLVTMRKLFLDNEFKGFWIDDMELPDLTTKYQHATIEEYNSLTTDEKYIRISGLDSPPPTYRFKVGDIININKTESPILTLANFEITQITSSDIYCKQATRFSNPQTYENVEIYISNKTTLDTVLDKAAYFENFQLYRHMIRMGAYFCCFPDGVVYDTTQKDLFKMAHEKTLEMITEGAKHSNIYICAVYKDSNGNFVNKFDGNSDTFSSKWRIENNQLQEYLTESKIWVNRPAYTYIYYSGYMDVNGDFITPWEVPQIENTFGELKEGDVISIKINDAVDSNNCLKGEMEPTLENPNEYKEISKKILHKLTGNDGREYLVIEGLNYGTVTNGGTTIKKRMFEATSVTLKRRVPKVNERGIACEAQNRVWTCDRDGHEIYASALGDPYSYYDYSGLSTDSYAVNVGTSGYFTGCVNFLGQPLFFKEDSLHVISGSYPTNEGMLDGGSYAVTTFTDFKGLERGSEKSFAIIDNILYYKSTYGIVAYDGSTTLVISDALGKEKYRNAIATAQNNKYYVSMEDKNGTRHLFVYDTALGMWSKEDNDNFMYACSVDGVGMFMTTESVVYINPEEHLDISPDVLSSEVDWMCETGEYGYSYPNNKYLSRFQIRLQIAKGARASVFIQYDSDGVWQKKGEMESKGTKTYLLPIVPQRCDHMKLKFEGKGDVKIVSIAKILEEGGDV